MSIYRSMTPAGYEQVSSLSGVKTLTVPAGARFAYFQAVTKDVNFTDDGSNPSASLGMRLYGVTTPHAPFFYQGNLKACKFIEVAASALLNVLYYK